VLQQTVAGKTFFESERSGRAAFSGCWRVFERMAAFKIGRRWLNIRYWGASLPSPAGSPATTA
jgi:hypothetical protein